MFNSDGYQGLGGDTTFRDHPQSELTFSDSTGVSYMALSQQNNFHLHSRLYQPAEVTTSDRLVVVSPPTTVMHHFSGDFASSLYSQSLEISDVIQFQRLQSGMELLRKKHCRHLLSEVKQQALKRLRVKEVELEILNQRNIELEEQLRQMSAECQVWFDYAKSTESVVSGLRKELEFVLTNKNTCPAVGVEEGYGDNIGDAESECETSNHKRACMVCGKEEVCVVLLPCQHLCLCMGCEARIDTCPVCNSIRNARIQVIQPIR